MDKYNFEKFDYKEDGFMDLLNAKSKQLLHMSPEPKKDKKGITVYNNSFMNALYLNDCYGVSDKIRYNLTEGWNLTKKYYILVDSLDAFESLKACFYDLFCSHELNTNEENNNSGVGINSNLFSGELTEDDCRFIPSPRKIKESLNSVTYKFDKQTIIITMDTSILLNYKKGMMPTINDIGFFTFGNIKKFNDEDLIDYAVELKTYKSWVENHKNDSIEEIIKWINEGRFAFNPNTLPEELKKDK